MFDSLKPVFIAGEFERFTQQELACDVEPFSVFFWVFRMQIFVCQQNHSRFTERKREGKDAVFRFKTLQRAADQIQEIAA